MKSDRELQIDVLDELRWEPGVNATDIGATVKDGVVTLEGTVDSFAEKWAAEKAVKRLPGVKALAVETQSRASRLQRADRRGHRRGRGARFQVGYFSTL